MSQVVKLTNLTTDIDLIYDPGTQDNYRMKYGASLQLEDTNVQQHIPDDGEPVVVRANDLDSTMILTKDVYGDTQDEVLNKITAVKRWVDGDDQEALVNGGIYLRIQNDGATNYTQHTVKWGFVDDSQAFYRPETSKPGAPKFAMGIVVVLHLKPKGTGAKFTLRNDLIGSPHMVESSSGLALGLSHVGTPVTSILTSRYLIGGSCQRMDVDNLTSEGVDTTAPTAAIGTDFVAYVWVFTGSTQDPLTIALRDSSGLLASKMHVHDAPTGFDMTALDNLGGTWYRYSFATTTVGTNPFIRTFRGSGEATAAGAYLIDGLYLQLDATELPPGVAWSSASSIENRYDPSAANPSQRNYVDTWGIPGDSDALVDIQGTITNVSGFPFRMHIARISDGSALAANRQYWFDTLVAGGVISGSYATISDASRSGGNYLRYTSTSSGGANFTFSIDKLADFVNWPSRVFALTRTSDTSSTIALSAIGSGTVSPSGNGYTVTNTWEWIDLGLHSPSDKPIEKLVPLATSTGLVNINATAGSVTIEIDTIIALPVTDNGFLIGESTSYTVGDTINLLSEEEQYFVVSGASGITGGWLGESWACRAGQFSNRYIFNVSNVNSAHSLTNTFTVELTVTPRSRHLLGTI